MSKKCLRCGCDLSDDNVPYCPQCCDELDKLKKEVQVDGEAIEEAEDVLISIAKWALISGIIIAIILFCVGVKNTNHRDYGYIQIGIAIYVFFCSIIISAFLKVLCIISDDLHEINSKLKK